ncbi:MAG: TetR/AcrR family transcriptional regulator [Acidimicrobiia bacterium]
MSSASGIDRTQRRHETKQAAIVAEAWILARRDGLSALSLRDLAERVDLRQPSLYAYFDSKLALYDAMYVDGYRQMLEQVRALPHVDDPREALIQFVEFCVRFATQDVVRHQLLFQRTIPGFKPSPASRTLSGEFLEIGSDRLMGVAAIDVARGDGFVFTAIVAGFTTQQVFNDPNGDRWLQLSRRAIEMFLADVDQRSKPSKPSKPVKSVKRSARSTASPSTVKPNDKEQ